jgi:predicted RNase H-like HicB family nuclease
MASADYPLIVVPLPAADGGGWLAQVPDLPGCMSDGETPEEAVRNLRDAIAEWIDAARRMGRDVPAPRAALAVA